MPCEKCGGNTQGLISDNNPSASEFYCSKCHKSKLMTNEQYRQFKHMKQQRV